MATPNVGSINRDALLEFLGLGALPDTAPAVQQPGAPAPGGYDAPLRVEGTGPVLTPTPTPHGAPPVPPPPTPDARPKPPTYRKPQGR